MTRIFPNGLLPEDPEDLRLGSDVCAAGTLDCAATASGLFLPPRFFQESSPLRVQTPFNTCAPFAVADAVEDLSGGATRPSEWWLYWHARRIGGSLEEDIGSKFSALIRALRVAGAPDESAFPYKSADPFTPPPYTAQNLAYPARDAWKMRAISSTGDSLRVALLQNRRLLVGVRPDARLMDGEPGYVGADAYDGEGWAGEGPPEGAHAIRIIGYEQTKNGRFRYKAKNWWGDWWGEAGYFWIGERAILSPSAFLGAYEVSR